MKLVSSYWHSSYLKAKFEDFFRNLTTLLPPKKLKQLFIGWAPIKGLDPMALKLWSSEFTKF